VQLFEPPPCYGQGFSHALLMLGQLDGLLSKRLGTDKPILSLGHVLCSAN